MRTRSSRTTEDLVELDFTSTTASSIESSSTTWKLAEINSKIENLNTRVYSLENHASSVAAATKQGQLPGKAVQNPKEQCKVIFTQEGLEEEDQERVMEEFCLLLNDDEIVAAEAPGVQIDQPEVQLLAIHTSPVELAQQARSAARSSRTLARSKVLKVSTHQINLLTSPTFLPKVKDQGKFTLPCTLGHIELDNALVDSGASINLISLSNGRKLGIAGALQRPTTSIMFGDATSKSPLGVFKNYHLKIGECIIQTDLTVMEMEEEKDLPLLLGTPFLSTVGASIDFHKQEVILHKKDPPAQAPSAKPSQLTMTLFPTKFENGKIEYKIRYKGRSRPFSRAKALVTSEQSRDPTKLKELLSQVLTITLDGGTSSTNA
ncbi:unnamed protein product [Microthlaspi erraticum]|uniref:Uncharacterized protein n=1 Tax=Microthlaspi erraticum TaxID=1685480 RepID=A0A6D2K6Z9_9BRAS|nr:unnamed protein product [Microthlaspi erraticum]